MAAVDRAFNGIPLSRMDYHQPSHYLQRTEEPGVAESHFLASLSGLGQGNGISMTSPMNNNAYLGTYSHFTSSAAGGNSNPDMGAALPLQNLLCAPGFSPTSSRFSAPAQKKHKRQEDISDCPLKRRRLSKTKVTSLIEGQRSSGSIFVGENSARSWNSTHPVSETSTVPCLGTQSSHIVDVALTEDMEEAVVESPCDAARRKIEDIESRLIIGDEDDIEPENSSSRLPTLILSDFLKDSLKNGFDEPLNKKIVESMSRPSMEIVLWKPQPEFLIDKLQSISKCYKDNTDVGKDNRITSVNTFPQEVSEDHLCTSNVASDINTMWDRDEEEEMEL
ncbi:coiled-coil domain-containing protein 117 [Spea bombifrons]|uniref:coiled-coil domain-containing protein 117 n=1 Tax=Spea bombifrons TaxID=233779 RepID=UPI002349E50B|nr:coiled-coil domain-containing protein 117 [Spea bombifrons]